jgi:hypothetical protein
MAPHVRTRHRSYGTDNNISLIGKQDKNKKKVKISYFHQKNTAKPVICRPAWSLIRCFLTISADKMHFIGKKDFHSISAMVV